MRKSLSSVWVCGLVFGLAVACSGTNSGSSNSGVGGSPGVGGAIGTVGGTTTAGPPASGGTQASSTTSVISSGGSLSTGGASAVNPASGGTNASGGKAPTGGVGNPAGGANTGGLASATGGSNPGIGGTKATGGAATGGSKATGGAATGGASTTNGGTKASGGSSSTGGTTSAGGSAGGPSAEDSGADCTIGTLPTSSSLQAITKLPDPFTKLDGTRISTKADWRCRREEIKRLGEQFAYGSKGTIPTTTGSVTKSTISVSVSLNGKTSTFSATVQLPTSGSAPYPAIVVYGGAGFGAPLDSNVINSEGVALISYDPYTVGAEGTGRANKQGAYYTIYGASSTTGLLVAWGWGVSRIIDVIAKSDGSILKADAVGVTGCSRFGKGAFIAGAFDERIALTMPIESGTGGVPIWRNVNQEGAQSLSSAYGEQPWFGDAFSAFTSAPTKAPIDTHEVIGMIAPRGLFIMDNPHIKNLGPISADISAQAGAEIYKALGVSDAITYYSNVANGTHCSQRPEWSTPLKNNIQRFLKKTGNAPGAINAYSGATGNLATWRDWTTPTLN